MWRGTVEACLGHIRHIGVTAVAEVIEEVLPVTFRVAYTIPLLVLRATAPMARHAVTCIEPCQWMVAFGVTNIISNFADITVRQNQAVSKGGIGDVVDAKLPGDVVGDKGIIELLVLQADLVVGYGWLHPSIVPNIYDTISYFLGSTEGPKVVVVCDDLNIVADSLTTCWRVQRCVQ